jgi:exosortase N
VGAPDFVTFGRRLSLPQSKAIGLPYQLIFPFFYACILGYWCWSGYLAADATFYAGIVLAPLVFKPESTSTHSFRWAIWAGVSLCAAYFLPSRSLHFFALAFAIMHFVENYWGKIAGEIAILWVLVMSALLRNIVIVFGFPIRLALSQYAAKSLALLGMQAHAEGNQIWLNGNVFAVDPACMGLSMVLISQIFALTISQINIGKETEKKTLSLSFTLFLLTSVCALNLIFNLLRIILLVIFGWKPETAMHDIGGLVGLVLYVFIPTWFLTRWLHSKFGVSHQVNATQTQNSVVLNRQLIILSHILFALAITWISVVETRRTLENPKAEYPKINLNLPEGQFETTQLDHGIQRFSSDSVLIFAKPIPGFYASEHTPLVCWEGSGYQFLATNKARLPNGTEYYTGTLQKPGTEPLHTAWWYSNGQTTTLSQWHWRWLDLTGEPSFFLINLTSTDENCLKRAIEVVMGQ